MRSLLIIAKQIYNGT